MTDLNDLKHRIRTEWTKLDHAVRYCSCCASVTSLYQRVSRPAAVISSTVFDFDIEFSANLVLHITLITQIVFDWSLIEFRVPKITRTARTLYDISFVHPVAMDNTCGGVVLLLSDWMTLDCGAPTTKQGLAKRSLCMMVLFFCLLMLIMLIIRSSVRPQHVLVHQWCSSSSHTAAQDQAWWACVLTRWSVLMERTAHPHPRRS